MGKDPAVLFYTSDFLSGVMLMSMKERGQFITLLCLQRERGHLSEKDVRKAVGALSEDVRAKFVADENGLFYNPRMESEIRKRQAHAQKQRENVNRRWHPEGEHAPTSLLAAEGAHAPTSLLAAEVRNATGEPSQSASLTAPPEGEPRGAEALGAAEPRGAARATTEGAADASSTYKNTSSAAAESVSLKNQTNSLSSRGESGNTTVLPFGNGNGRGNESENGFEEFWKEYPKKVARQEAEKCWRKLRPDAALREKILRALRVQKQSRQWTRDGGEFIPHPATWLHQRRFEDELTSASAAETPSVSGDKFRDAGGEDYAARLQRMIDKYKEDSQA